MNAKDNINRGSESPEARFLKGLVWVAVAGLLAACEINDPVGEISRPGFMAAGVYWDVPVTNVTAGNEVAFQAQYWSVDKRFTSLGVWYDVVRKMKYSLIFPPRDSPFYLIPRSWCVNPRRSGPLSMMKTAIPEKKGVCDRRHLPGELYPGGPRV